jgi:hypothetical protein
MGVQIGLGTRILQILELKPIYFLLKTGHGPMGLPGLTLKPTGYLSSQPFAKIFSVVVCGPEFAVNPVFHGMA